MNVPRVAVAGVVRRRQGIGEHLARFVVRHGGEVPAFLGSREASLAEGADVLRRHGIESRGFTGLDALLAECPVDALVIASPAETHRELLDAALAAGLHVLCEKPLLRGGDDDAGDTAGFVSRFGAAGLLLWENVQWPFTLEAFRQLHPAAADAAVRHFEMRLSPMEGGASHMLQECMSHPLSLLQALDPPARDGLDGLMFRPASERTDRLEISFRYPGTASGTAVSVTLAAVAEQPRPAGFAVNGLRADRRVRMGDYALTFHHGDRSVDVPDPTDALVAAFVGALRGAAPPSLPLSGPAVSWRARALREIVTGFERVRAHD